MGMRNYLEAQVLNHLASLAAWTAPADLYLGLITADAGDGGAVTETDGAGYARQVITCVLTAGQLVTDGDAVFTATDAWDDDIIGAALYDAATAGNCLWTTVAFDDPISVAEAGDLTLAAGDVTFTLD